jgi:hypothetical protein
MNRIQFLVWLLAAIVNAFAVGRLAEGPEAIVPSVLLFISVHYVIRAFKAEEETPEKQ